MSTGKKVEAVGTLMCCTAVVLFVAASQTVNPSLLLASPPLFLAGLTTFIVGRFLS